MATCILGQKRRIMEVEFEPINSKEAEKRLELAFELLFRLIRKNINDEFKSVANRVGTEENKYK